MPDLLFCFISCLSRFPSFLCISSVFVCCSPLPLLLGRLLWNSRTTTYPFVSRCKVQSVFGPTGLASANEKFAFIPLFFCVRPNRLDQQVFSTNNWTNATGAQQHMAAAVNYVYHITCANSRQLMRTRTSHLITLRLSIVLTVSYFKGPR